MSTDKDKHEDGLGATGVLFTLQPPCKHKYLCCLGFSRPAAGQHCPASGGVSEQNDKQMATRMISGSDTNMMAKAA